MTVVRDGNRILFGGSFSTGEIHRPLAAIHQAVNDFGYQDIVLDFRACEAAFAGPMLALCAQVMRLRESRVDAELLLPTSEKLSRLFRNANWAHFLEPRNHAPSSFRGHSQIAATQFKTPEEQFKAVNRIVNAILGAIPDIERSNFAALEWSINEITDNVITHSESPIGGLVQVSTFSRNKKVVEYIVADAGLGIPATLRSGRPDLTQDTEALDQAIREGVTRDPSLGQGNGLFGSYQICSHSGGRFQIDSGHAKLAYDPDPRKGLSIHNERIPLDGTLVMAQIDFTNPQLLSEALKFAGKRHVPVDFVEIRYELGESNDLKFTLTEESPSFGSRIAGTPVRVKLANLLRMCPDQRVEVDFANIPLVSSSFADEVFGKLFVQLGPLAFMQRIVFRNMASTVRSLVDKAIAQRMVSGLGASDA